MHWNLVLVGVLTLASTSWGQAQTGVMVTNIAHLRRQLNQTTFVPTNTAQIFQVEGIVTSWTNLAVPAHGMFYLQDDTAGIAVFHSGAAGVVPPAGARVRVRASLSQFNGLLELVPRVVDVNHRVQILETGRPLPLPRRLGVGTLAALSTLEKEMLEGSLVSLTNVTLADPARRTFVGGVAETLLDAAGFAFSMQVDARTDIPNQVRTSEAFSVTGVLGQFDNAAPWDSGYLLLPTRFADVLIPRKPPTIRFTCRLTQVAHPGDVPVSARSEYAVHQGDELEIEYEVTDPEARPMRIEAGVEPGLPAGAGWDPVPPAGATVTGGQRLLYRMTGTEALAGRVFRPTLKAWNDVATNVVTVKIYVPTAAEQAVVLMEIFANPSSTGAGFVFNPLQRASNPEDPARDDEFLELVNFSAAAVDLRGWRIEDAVGMRHEFRGSFVIPARSAGIVYGGPLRGLTPNLGVPVAAANAGGEGLSLDDLGDTIEVYNAGTNLVFRMVYVATQVSSATSLARYPDASGLWVEHSSVARLQVSPGLQSDGRSYLEPMLRFDPISVTARRGSDGQISLRWNATPGVPYTVWSAETLTTGFRQESLRGMQFPNGLGQYVDPIPVTTRKSRFYRVSTP
ncbi:MAG: lamin tail domain-containing protein [Verrucomicrobiales bacterium]|nr:lamin tail domain-containing protein [Verrucomicrobiales bacterium]